MKKLLATLLILTVTTALAFGLPPKPTQPSFDSFWQKFRTAVKNKDKNAVADLSRFPLSMPYRVPSVNSRTAFIKNYDKIINMEANAARCFEKNKPKRENAKNYEIYCSFKSEPEGTGEMPIVYFFELTKTGWKFVGLDNINS